MRPPLHPFLVNGPFGDPGLFVDLLFERRGLGSAPVFFANTGYN